MDCSESLLSFVIRFRLIYRFLLCFYCAPCLDVIVVTFIPIIRLCSVTRFGLLLVVFVCFHYTSLLDVLSSFHISATTPLLRRSTHLCNFTFPQQICCSGGHNIHAKLLFRKKTVFRRPIILASFLFSNKNIWFERSQHLCNLFSFENPLFRRPTYLRSFCFFNKKCVVLAVKVFA